MNRDKEFFACHLSHHQAGADARFALSGSAPHYAPDRTCDITHLKLELDLDIKGRTLTGKVTASVTALTDDVESMVFDAVDFKNLKVASPGRSTRFQYNSRKITVSWAQALRRGDKAEVVISYKVVEPKLGLFFILPDKGYPTKPAQVWTQGEDEYNHFWFPCHDAPQERMTTETLITVPASFTAVSNGALQRVIRKGNRRTFHYKQNVPHPAYLTSLAVGEFSEIKDKWGKIPVLYYCPKGREEDAKRAFSKTPKMMDFFSKALGVPYAYAKYSQVAALDFIYGGMENISATTQTAFTLHDERAHLDFSSDPLVAHELAHQWFGDLVTCKDWSHAWLNESFATYFEALFKEHDMGQDEFLYELHENAQAYFSEDRERYRRAMVTHTYKNTNDLFDRHLYEKGSLILHMLRCQLGDKAFWRSMNVYLKAHYAQGVETVDLINAIQEATGKNMRPFFDQWIYKGGHPEYKVRSWWNAKEKKVYLRVLQTHGVNAETGLFSLPITLAFYTSAGVKRHTETVDKKEQIYSYALPAEPQMVLFDADHNILKKVDFVRSEAMLIFQLTHDPHILGRLEAAQALGQSGGPRAVQALSEALLKEPFWGTAGEIARALGRTGTVHAMDALVEALAKIDHPKVRRAIYEALGNFRHVRVQSELQDRFGTEKSYFAEAEAIQSLGRMRDPSLFPMLKKLTERDSWNDVLRNAALEAIAQLKLPESVEMLKKFTAYGHSPQSRMTAIRGLMGLGAGREDVQNHFIALLKDKYLLVQMAVVRGLGAIGDERAVPELLKLTQGDLDGRLKRTAEESIRKIRKGMEQEMPPVEKK